MLFKLSFLQWVIRMLWNAYFNSNGLMTPGISDGLGVYGVGLDEAENDPLCDLLSETPSGLWRDTVGEMGLCLTVMGEMALNVYSL